MKSPAGEVLRGMEVHDVPRRLPRERGAKVPVEVAAPPQVDDDFRSKGFEVGREQGWEAGLRAGQEEGRRIARQELTTLVKAEREKLAAQAASTLREAQEQTGRLAAALGAAMDDCMAAAEDEIVALCFESVCAVLGSCAIGPQQIREQVRLRAATWWNAGEGVVVRLHPQDAVQVGEAVAEWPPALRFQPDADVSLGGCIVVGSRGGLDLRLDTLLQGLKDTLLQVRASRAADAGGAS